MPVTDTSLIALEKVNKRLEPDQWAVYAILEELGPAPDKRILEAMNQKERANGSKRRWAINQVTARRNELVKLQLVRCIGTYRGIFDGQKKTYAFWAVAGDDRQPAGWQRLPDKPVAVKLDDKCANCLYRRQVHLRQIQENAERPILERLQVSEAGSVLANSRKDRKNNPQKQLTLNFG
jgi:hypothetical protein